MKVHYKQTIIDQIIESIYEAKEDNREIDLIELDDHEMMEFKREIYTRYPGSLLTIPIHTNSRFMDVSIVKEAAVDDEDEDY